MTLKSIIISIFLLLLQTQLNAQVHKLEIKFDHRLHGESLHEFIDNAVLIGRNLSSSIEWTYDTTKHYYKYRWENVPTGKYRFIINTNFFKKIEIPIVLKSDTIITINKEYLFTEVGEITQKEMKLLDTISILYVVSGCWTHNLEKYRITKDNHSGFNLYAAEKQAHSDGENWKIILEKTVQFDIIEMIYKMQIELTKLPKYMYSTRMESIYIQAGNNLFHAENDDLPDWMIFKNKLK